MVDDKTEATGTDEGAKATEEKPAQSPDSGEDKTGLRAALAKQAEDKNAEIAKLTKQINDNAAASLKSKEDKLKADNKLQELLDARDATIRDMTEKSTAAARALLEGAAREKLRDLGMTRALSLAGAVAGLPADATAETLEAWAAQMKVGNEAEFTEPVTKVAQSSVGAPATNATDGSLKTRLQSDDKNVKLDALKEELVGTLSGELADGWKDK